MKRPPSRLAPWQQAITLLLNISLGLVPSFLFFIWMERNCSLPIWISPAAKWDTWRLLDLQSQNVAIRAGFDILLILGFGFGHSLFAQPFVHQKLNRWIPPQAIRTAYLSITGVSALLVMAFWQSTGLVIWALPVQGGTTMLFSMLIFWACFAGCGALFSRFGAGHFFGTAQIFQKSDEMDRVEGNPELIESGMYAWVRHPVYLLGAVGLLVTPFMTFDRILLTATIALYLYFAIPIEEKKLIAIFGQRYEDYRMRVPAVFPRWPTPGGRLP